VSTTASSASRWAGWWLRRRPVSARCA